MAALKKEQVEQKMQQLKQLSGEISALTKELAEAGVIKLSEEDLEKVAGGEKQVVTYYGHGWSERVVIDVPSATDSRPRTIPKRNPPKPLH